MKKKKPLCSLENPGTGVTQCFFGRPFCYFFLNQNGNAGGRTETGYLCTLLVVLEGFGQPEAARSRGDIQDPGQLAKHKESEAQRVLGRILGRGRGMVEAALGSPSTLGGDVCTFPGARNPRQSGSGEESGLSSIQFN